ncbi:MAG TPA: hypothetical protein VN922_14630 [Bacteroidia bacterium]|nr:hypothetical protein [Bacteroidia bacterium]
MKTNKVLLGVFIVAGVFTSAQAQQDTATLRDRDVYNPQVQYYAVTKPGAPTGYFALNFGAAMPISRYASTMPAYYGGYAMPGTALNLSGGFLFDNSNLGLAVMAGSSDNPFNENMYVSNINSAEQANGYSATIQDYYDASSILVGVFYTIPVHRISFDLQALTGVMLNRFPEVSYAAYRYDPTLGTTTAYTWDIAPSTGSALAYDLGGGIRYNFGDMSVRADVNYLYGDPAYNTTEVYTQPGNNPTYTILNSRIPVSLLNFTIGLGYQIGR